MFGLAYCPLAKAGIPPVKMRWKIAGVSRAGRAACRWVRADRSTRKGVVPLSAISSP